MFSIRAGVSVGVLTVDPLFLGDFFLSLGISLLCFVEGLNYCKFPCGSDFCFLPPENPGWGAPPSLLSPFLMSLPFGEGN